MANRKKEEGVKLLQIFLHEDIIKELKKYKKESKNSISEIIENMLIEKLNL